MHEALDDLYVPLCGWQCVATLIIVGVSADDRRCLRAPSLLAAANKVT